jgi:hypothetical protein
MRRDARLGRGSRRITAIPPRLHAEPFPADWEAQRRRLETFSLSHESLREAMLLHRQERRLEASERFGDDVIGVAGAD